MRPEPSRAAALFGPSPSRGHEGLAERLELEDRWALIGWMRADLIPAQKLQEQPELAQRAYVTERCAELSAQITPEPLKDPRQVLDYAAWARTLEPAYLDWSLPDHQARAETLYARHCASCHGADGAGGPDGVPPLAGSDWLKERAPEELVDVLLQGLRGEIVVNGRAYQGAMPGFADRLDDVELAAIASHVLTRWRPSGAPMAPDRVAARRGALALPPDPPGPNPRGAAVTRREGALVAQPCQMCHQDLAPLRALAREDLPGFLDVLLEDPTHPAMGRALSGRQLAGLVSWARADGRVVTPAQVRLAR